VVLEVDMLLKEDEHTEFKRQITEEIKKEVVAFANSNGGTLYIGIDDDGTVVGVFEPTEEQLRINNMIRDGVKPDITMFVDSQI
jgi:ATP-dependent DNA helicase RecG